MAYVDLTARFVYGLQTVFGDFSKLANNDKFMKENGWQDGTVGIFFQAAAPTGWTKVVTTNARALRVVSGTGGGTGGSQDPATAIALAHTHSIATQADHTHTLQAHTQYLATSGSDGAAGTGVVPIMLQSVADSVYPVGALSLRVLAGSTQEHTVKNELPMLSTPTSTASGSHAHGGATDSVLTDLSLAYVDVLFCSKDTSSGYTDLSATFVHNTRHVADYMQQLAANDAYNFARATPSGTVSLFSSVTAPVGWTKLTSQNAKMLRVTSGTGGGTGGTSDPATTIVLAHSHAALTASGTHTHTFPNHQHQLSNANSIFAISSNSVVTSGSQLRERTPVGTGTGKAAFTNSDGTGTSSADGNHQHTPGSSLADISLAYLDVIQASKDSGGAPAAYTDITALFATYFTDQFLLAYQEMQLLANNDAYLYFHTMPSAAVMFFFQASAPLNWTKLTTQNDALLRVVSGATGGTGAGSSPLSSSFLLAHTHTLDTSTHSHTLTHHHTLADLTITGAAGTLLTSPRIFGAHGAEMYRDNNGGAGDTSLGEVTEDGTVTGDDNQHNHGGATGSSLSNITLAYADVIRCSKN